MTIIVKNQQATSMIDTRDADITELMDMIIGALMQEGLHISIIREGLEQKVEELRSINT